MFKKAASSSDGKKNPRVSIQEPSEATPLFGPPPSSSAATRPSPGLGGDGEDAADDYSYSDYDFSGAEEFVFLKDSVRRESIAADKLSMRLLEIDDDDSVTEDQILRETLAVDIGLSSQRAQQDDEAMKLHEATRRAAMKRLCTLIGISILSLAVIGVALYLGVEYIGPPNQPVGPYELMQRQEGPEFFSFYTFYEGPDSVGSNGYLNYVSQSVATSLGIANVTYEEDELDLFRNNQYATKEAAVAAAAADNSALASTRKSTNASDTSVINIDEDKLNAANVLNANSHSKKGEPFLYMKSSPTPAGPRNSIRLEGKQRFNRGLFIIDVRHMPAGCGVWSAFWMTDEANWPVNGEIDIVEGINYQSEAKTALHTTTGCRMDDVPLGVKSGGWDTAVGIPDKKTGIPDMTFREARNCFVYDPHQWINQGCVAVDTKGGSLGVELNKKGGGVFVLEWDPVNSHIRSWVFSPHTSLPENLIDAIRTASEPVIENRIMPNPEEWPLPYGYFPIGDQTQCPSRHFRNMRLVLNTAFCGSVAGNRFQVDCKNQSKSFKTCNSYIKSQPTELDDAYWKIRGVYVYQRSWQKAWLGK